jgi:hypothetical protein
MKRIYLSGPITALGPQEAAKAFDWAELLLADQEEDFVFNPWAYFHDFSRKEEEFGFPRTFTEEGSKTASWEDFMDVALHILMRGGFDSIVLLPGWRNSPGATIEAVTAMATKMKVLEIDKSGALVQLGWIHVVPNF